MQNQRKTIILAMPYVYGLDQCIEENLRLHGFDVINLCFDERDSYYPNLFARLIHCYHKRVRKDLNYRKGLTYSRYRRSIDEKLAALGGKKADYALCIRANIYPKEIIADIRAHSKVCVNYQWDGMERFPDIFQYLSYFDRFWVFSREDAEKYPQHGFKEISNFYFDFDVEADQTAHGLYFLGGYDKDRADATMTFLNEARRLKLPLDFHMYCHSDSVKIFGDEGIRYLDRNNILNFKQNLQKVKNCTAVVDFLTPVHTGLSFRAFDALRFGKKLITTNASVTRYDFYHPDNVFVWDGKNLDGLEAFLAKPYREPPEEIRKKYGFENWIRQVLDIPPYIPSSGNGSAL